MQKNIGTPRDLFLASVQKKSKTPFTWDDVEIASITPALGAQGTNTLVRISANPHGRYNGNSQIRIYRPDIKSLFKGIEVIIDPKDFYNSAELLPELKRLYDLNLEHTDIVNTQLPRKYPATIQLRMSPDNIALVGSLEIKLVETGLDISEAFLVDVIPEAIIPDTDPNMITGRRMYMVYDFSHSSAELNAINTGAGNAYAIQSILGRYVDDPWVVEAKLADFNLYGAITVAAKQMDEGGKQVTVKLSPLYCRNIQGELTLQYRADL